MKVVLDETSNKIRLQIEEYIRLSLKSKPKLCPNWLWKKLLQRIVNLEYFTGGVDGFNERKFAEKTRKERNFVIRNEGKY